MNRILKYIVFFMLMLTFGRSVQSQFSSHLPIVVIDTDGKNIPDDNPRLIAHMGVIDNGQDQENDLNDPFNDYDGRISIEHRGSSSLMFPWIY